MGLSVTTDVAVSVEALSISRDVLLYQTAGHPASPVEALLENVVSRSSELNFGMASADWGGQDRRSTVNIACWTLNGLTTVTVALRLLSRTTFGTAKLGLDDGITVLCVWIVYASTIAVTLGTEVGWGQHLQDINPEHISEAIKRIVIMNFFVVWAFSMPKFAILALLRRLLRLGKWEARILWGVAIVNQCGIFALSVYWFARCRPAAKQWIPSLEGVCDDVNILGDLGYAFSATSAALDISFAVYPIFVVMRLQIPLRKRIGISASLALGCLACAISVYKLSCFPSIVIDLPVDPTWASVPLIFFSIVESNILILTASLATLGPLIRWIRGESHTISPATKWHTVQVYGPQVSHHRSRDSSMHTDATPLVLLTSRTSPMPSTQKE